MAPEYTITREGEPSGALVLRADGRPVGRLDFRASGEAIDVDYVVVDDALRGLGMGRRLVNAAVAWARETGRVLRPHCGYAARVLHGDARYRDVLAGGGGEAPPDRPARGR
jgi:predicted GNAT family acetyltransferase